MPKAIDLFTAVPKLHNCAQAVIEGAGHPDRVPEMAACGGGRAPGGTCGALYAAMQCVPEDRRAELQDAFRETMPSTLCRELKANGVPCVKCVSCAAELVERFS